LLLFVLVFSLVVFFCFFHCLSFSSPWSFFFFFICVGPFSLEQDSDLEKH
jgi:hypothetical protein